LERILIRHADEMTVLHATAQAATQAISEDDLIERITTIIGATLYPDNFGILILDPATHQLVIHPSYHGMDMTKLSNRVNLNTGITGQVAASGQPLRVADVTQHKGYTAASPVTRSELCVPIKVDTHVIGVINAESTTLDAFSQADEKILTTIAGQIATTLEKLRLFDALRQSESNYRALVEQLPAITYEVTLARTPDEVNLTTYISPRVESILGFSPEEWMTEPELWIDLLHPDDHERVVGEVRAHERDGAPLSIEYRSLTRDGRVVWFHNQYAHIAAPEGQPHRLHGIMLDITELKQAEEALRDSENIFRRAIEAAGAVPYRRDHRTNSYIYMGEGIRAITGYDPSEYTSELLDSLIVENRLGPAAGNIGINEAIALARSGHLPQWQNDILIRTRGGDLRWIADSSVEILNETGESIGSIGILQDITERRSREREMEAIATLSAQLRTANDRTQIVPIVTDQLIEIMHSDTATFVIHDAASGHNRIELTRGRLAEWTGRTMEGGAGIIGHVITTGQPYTTADLHKDSIGNDQALFPPGTSIGCAPLIAQGQTLGALSVSRTTALTESDMRILTAIADIAASAYRRAILYDETRHRADQLAAVNRLGRTLSETFDVADIYRQVHETIFQLIPDVAALSIESFDDREQLIHIEYSVQDGEVLNSADLPSQSLELASLGLQSTVIASRQPLVVNDLQGMNWRNVIPWRPRTPIEVTKSALLAPMLAKGAVRGVVQLQSYSINRFTQNDAELLSFIANTAAIAIENARLFAETQLRLQRMQALHRIDEAVSASLDLRLTLNVMLTQAITQLGVDATSVLLLRSHNQSLEYAAGQGFRTRAIEQSSIRIGVGVTGRAALERRPTYAVRIDDIGNDFQRRNLLAAEGFKSYYAVPIIAKGNIKGVLEFFHRSNLETGHEWEDFADTLARQAAIAVENIVLFDDLQRTNTELTLAYDTTLEGWSHALDLRDKETEGHTERVTELAVQLGRAMGMGEADILNLRRGSLLHDIGKMGIPDAILLKQGPLNEDEWTIMRKHPEYAYDLLKPIAFLKNALDIPYCHHERWDGTGYPRGLLGTEIPLAARVFSVVDVWDALRSNRPYREAWPEETVLGYIEENSGEQFDPQVVQIFLAMIH
jgi:PAS domain S-box-containing protein